MLKVFLLSLYVQLSCSMNYSNYKSKSQPIDSVFTNWNKATLLSLERQLNSSIDAVKKEYYQNRILAFKAYLRINNPDIIDTNSIRYTFLKEILPFKKASDIYVIEANSSGQKVLLRSFVFYSSAKGVNVEIYKKGEKWKKVGSFEVKNFSLHKNLQDYFAKKGFNDEDIIITRFENNNVKESEYFLFGTLASNSGIQNVIKIENMTSK